MSNCFGTSLRTLVLCIGLSLVFTTLTGFNPEFGGAPGSSGASFGLPINWRFQKWRPSIEEYKVVRREGDTTEDRQVPVAGPTPIRTFYSPHSFAIDVGFWSLLGFAMIWVPRQILRHH